MGLFSKWRSRRVASSKPPKAPSSTSTEAVPAPSDDHESRMTAPKQSSPVPSAAATPIEGPETPPAPASKAHGISKSLASPALTKAIEDHIASLSVVERNRFLTARDSMKYENLLQKVQEHNKHHADTSQLRKHTEKLETTFGALNNFISVVSAATSASAEATIAVGAVKAVLDVALRFVGFFSKFTSLLNDLVD